MRGNINHESKSIRVEQYSRDRNFIKIWPSLREVETEIRTASMTILWLLLKEMVIVGILNGKY